MIEFCGCMVMVLLRVCFRVDVNSGFWAGLLILFCGHNMSGFVLWFVLIYAADLFGGLRGWSGFDLGFGFCILICYGCAVTRTCCVWFGF